MFIRAGWGEDHLAVKLHDFCVVLPTKETSSRTLFLLRRRRGLFLTTAPDL